MDKTEKIIDMIEHPERYSEDELRSLLIDDAEGRDTYKTICYLNAAMQAEAKPRQHKPLLSLIQNKAAAIAIAVCLISGLAYATVRIVRPAEQSQQQTETTSAADTQRPARDMQPAIRVIESAPAVRTYENASLFQIVNDLANAYDVKVTYLSDKAKELRLYYKLDTNKPMEKIIEELNSFEKINIKINGDTLEVE